MLFTLCVFHASVYYPKEVFPLQLKILYETQVTALFGRGSLVPRLSAQLFFARSKISAFFTTCGKKLGREPGNEAMVGVERGFITCTCLVQGPMLFLLPEFRFLLST